MFKRIPFNKVAWPTSIFLILTLGLSLTVVPWYIWNHGMDFFVFSLFLFYCIATGLSITLGYHRLFSHRAFRAKLPVRIFTLAFGAAAFENSAYWWASEHRKHHKHVDQDEDPYDINKGFFWAHMGWLMFKLKPPLPINNVKDLEKDKWVMFQHNYVHLIGLIVGFIIPSLITGLYYGTWEGALGGFLLVGILRTVCVQHATFFINSLCHCVGDRPYSSGCSARDSWIMALFTFGEGYHNYHHTFEYDYRNGIRAWHWDPTKWSIWILAKLGLADNLRTVPEERILLVQMKEAQRLIQSQKEKAIPAKSPKWVQERFEEASKQLDELSNHFASYSQELQATITERVAISKDKINQWRLEVAKASEYLETMRYLEFTYQRA